MNSNKIETVLRARLLLYGKENLGELLYALAEAASSLSGIDRIRIYLEDLTQGVLRCVYANDSSYPELIDKCFPLISAQSLVSSVFAGQRSVLFNSYSAILSSDDVAFLQDYNISSSYISPITSLGKSIGVICLDSSLSGISFKKPEIAELCQVISIISERLDEARIYHQQVKLSRSLEEFKTREAAAMMVKSAVKLVEKLSLASVLIPTSSSISTVNTLDILASYSEEPELKKLYDEEGGIDLQKGNSLISRYLDSHAVISHEQMLKPLFIADLTEHALQKRALTETMELRSLYLVPRFNPITKKIICIVNYFSRDQYRFSDFEMGLLQTHAEMVERVISEVGGEHLEIRVLSEISELLNERAESLQPFLSKVLSKATELIGADTGSIAIVSERDGSRWLIVEEEDGSIVGAKNKEWLKKYIPPFLIGGDELPKEERSLTGYVAHSKSPKIISRVEDEQKGTGYHRSMSELLKSEIAVPIICDEEVIAVICLNSLYYDFFREEHRRILQIIGSLTARHISDLQRIEILQGEVTRLATDVAYKDPKVSTYRLGNIIGVSQKSQEVVDFINTVSPQLFNRIQYWHKNILQEATIGLPSILVTGETGSGKEFFFNNLYNTLNSFYRKKINPNGELPVKKSNIASYSGELTYSELFGHKKGAFTGGYADRRGILEETMGGIVFLDEIGDADPKTQVQLLRFLDNGGFVRLGENMERFSRVLLVAATNKNLKEEITAGRFREDLYHRLAELSIRLPSLNERREDIPDLAVHFLGKLYKTYRNQEDEPDVSPQLSPEAKDILMRHNYQGNIRELRSILLRALFFRRDNTIINHTAISLAIAGTGSNIHKTEVTSSITRSLDEQLTLEIMLRINEGGNFWTDVYEPFSRNDIPRETVRLVIEKARQQAGKTMPSVAHYLKAVDGNDTEDDKLKLYRFKNFLYKTVKI